MTLIVFVISFVLITFGAGVGTQFKDGNNEIETTSNLHDTDIRSPLEGQCFNNIFMAEWWSYVWCYGDHIRQIHYNHRSQRIETENHIGSYIPDESGPMHHIYRSTDANCLVDEKSGNLSPRYAEVTIECCEETGRHIPFPEVAAEAGGTVIANVHEPVPCSYYVTVCSEKICSNIIEKKNKIKDQKKKDTNNAPSAASVTSKSSGPVTLDVSEQELRGASSSTSMDSIFLLRNGNIPLIPDEDEQRNALERVREMFYHGYDSYIQNAFPEGDLNPLSCRGEPFDLIKIPLVTLVDSLDSLVIMGNLSEFRNAVNLVNNHYPSFDRDVNVSVFETTIRVLGGLLSAHLMAIDESIGIYNVSLPGAAQYDDSLLRLAIDLGNRLLPAFQTNTGIPYGTVNLRYGVPRGETEIASTAGAGSLFVEFEVLTRLSGDRKYGDVAYAATRALFDRRSSIGLLGKHIHTDTGRWFESVSGIGSNSDSFYEYLLKASLLFRKKEMYGMFSDAYASIKRFVQVGDWFSDVDMFNGKLRRNRVENLHAFWPGLEASLGFSHTGARQLNSFYSVWTSLGYLPEEFDNVEWLKGRNSMHPYYPLRPELIESTYMQYRTTKDRSWLAAGLVFVRSLERTRTSCGFASVNNMDTMELADSMPSFFLSETLKYLYLLFDEDNYVHDRAYIFSTEAHPFDPTQLPHVRRDDGLWDRAAKRGNKSDSALSTGALLSGEGNSAREAGLSEAAYSDEDEGAFDRDETDECAEEENISESSPTNIADMLPVYCSRRLWWDSADSFVFNYIVPTATDGSGKVESAESKSAGKMHPSWQMKLLSGNTPLPDALNMLLNIINSKKEPATEMEERDLVAHVERDHSAVDATSWGNVFALELAQQRTIARLRKVSKAVRQLEARGQLENSDRPVSTSFEPLEQFSVEASHAEFSAEQDGNDSSNEKKKSKNSKRSKKSKKSKKSKSNKKSKARSTHSVGTGSGSASVRAQDQRRPQTCYPEDNPSNAWADSPPPPGALQTVEVSMGPLGDFTVHVYSDGFIVRSRTDGDALEISNVGHDLMFVRDINVDSSITAIGDISGQSITCSVSIRLQDDTESAVGEEYSLGNVWRRTCSIAAFGGSDTPRDFLNYADAQTRRKRVDSDDIETFIPAHLQSSQYSESTVAPQELADVDTFCSTPAPPTAPSVVDMEKEMSLAKGDVLTGSTRNVRETGGVLGLLSNLVFGERGEDASEQSIVTEDTPIESEDKRPLNGDINDQDWADRSLSGKIAVARRGGCMFEEKAHIAERAGAKALIVINNENSVFIMSGQRSDDKSDGSSASESSSKISRSDKTITTVMLSSKDGDEFLHTLTQAKQSHADKVRVSVEISTKDMGLDSTLLGANEYPKLRLKKNLIHVVGRGRWGCILTSQNGGEWQLFIQRKEELNAVHVWPAVVINKAGELVTVTPNLSNNPVDLYATLLSRTCSKGLGERAAPFVIPAEGEDSPQLISLSLNAPTEGSVSSDAMSLMNLDVT